MSRSGKYISKLVDHRVLVLGGTSGIGFAVAEAAVEHGAQVIVSSSTQEKVNSAIERLRDVPRLLGKQGDDVVTGKTCDVANPDTVESNLEELLKSVTSNGTHLLDHVVFTAGNALQLKPTADTTAGDFVNHQAVRLIAPFILGKLLPKYVNQSAKSSYTLLTGVNAIRPPPAVASLTAQSIATEGVARGLAVELKPVRVNTVTLGLVPTEMHALWPEDVKKFMFDSFRAKTLVNELGKPEDVAEAFLYTMKDAFVTGSVIITDGGNLLT